MKEKLKKTFKLFRPRKTCQEMAVIIQKKKTTLFFLIFPWL